MIEIDDLIKKNRNIREKYFLKTKNVKHDEFGNLVFYEGMTFTDYEDKDIILAHAYLHRSYWLKNPDLSKEILISLHKKIIKEMLKRNLSHSKFDDLDDFET